MSRLPQHLRRPLVEQSPRLLLPRLHPPQQAMRDGALRYNVARCGRRFGKTALGLDLLIDDSMLRGLPVAWFAPTYRVLEDVYREAKRLLVPLTAATNKTEMRLELVTGGVMEFWTLDGPDPARGRKYARIVVDEAAMVRDLKTRWEQAIRPTLTDLKGDAWFMSTPKGKNFFAELCQRGQTPARVREGWRDFHAPSAANPFLDPAEIEAARRELPDLVFRQEYLAEFVDLQGGVVRRDWLVTGEAPEGARKVFGVDLAISTKDDADWTAVAVMSRTPDGLVWIHDVRRIRAQFHGAMEFIKAMAAEHRPVCIAIEQVQFQAAVIQELLRTTTLPVRGVRPDKDKLTRFAPMLARYEQKLVRHSAGLPMAFIDELTSFPVGEHDDQIDSVSYAWSAIELGGRVSYVAGAPRVF